MNAKVDFNRLRELAMLADAQAIVSPSREFVIDVCAGELPRIMLQAERALIETGGGIYQRGGQLVRLATLDKDTVQHAVARKAGSTLIVPVSRDYLSLAFARAAKFQRFDKRSNEMRASDPPASIAGALLASVGEWRFPNLAGIVASPTLRSDGTLLHLPGYDAMSHLFAAFDPAEFPTINPRPSREDALAALDLLVGVFNESVFSGGSRAPSAFVAIAAAVTACVRPALSIAPAFGFSAYKQGSGKTTAAKVAALLATGRDPPVLAPTDDENEFKKALLSILIAGDPCVLIDNVAKPVDSAALCAALTSAIYSDRVLGVSQKISAPTLVTWLLTGNALEFVGDLTSRVLLSVLDPECENPEARPFRRNLGDYVLAHRGELVRAALTIPLAYNAAGSPVVNASRSRFAEWDGMVRRPLLWLGCADPLDTQANLRASDPVRETLVALLAAWRDVFGTDEKTVADAIAAAYKVGQSAASQLLEALQGAAGERGGEINARRLGKYLARNVRRIEAGNRFEAAGPDLTTRRQKYRVASVTSVISVSANPSREHGEGNCTGTSGTNAENAGNAGGCIRCRGEGCSWCTQK